MNDCWTGWTDSFDTALVLREFATHLSGLDRGAHSTMSSSGAGNGSSKLSALLPTADAMPHSSAITKIRVVLTSLIRTGLSVPSGRQSRCLPARNPMPRCSRVSSAATQSSSPSPTGRPRMSQARNPSPEGSIQPTNSRSLGRRCSIQSGGSTWEV